MKRAPPSQINKTIPPLIKRSTAPKIQKLCFDKMYAPTSSPPHLLIISYPSENTARAYNHKNKKENLKVFRIPEERKNFSHEVSNNTIVSFYSLYFSLLL